MKIRIKAQFVSAEKMSIWWKGKIHAVYMKSGDNEYLIWPEKDMEEDTK